MHSANYATAADGIGQAQIVRGVMRCRWSLPPAGHRLLAALTKDHNYDYRDEHNQAQRARRYGVSRAVLVSDTKRRRATDDHTGPPLSPDRTPAGYPHHRAAEELAGNHPLTDGPAPAPGATISSSRCAWLPVRERGPDGPSAAAWLGGAAAVWLLWRPAARAFFKPPRAAQA